jgi:hypothetical protein
MEKVETQSTSAHSAVCTDIVVRDGEQTRLIFRPEIVDNPTNPAARVRGRFIYQKKGRGESWEDFEKEPLTSLRKGESFQLEIKSGELHSLLLELRALYRLHRDQGVPQGRREFVLLEDQMARLLVASEPDLHQFLSAHSTDAVKTLQRVLRWLSESSAAADRFADDSTPLPEINALVGLANLRSVLKIWEENSRNGDEEFWQGVFERHAFILSQIFAHPIAIIKNKAYVGGKGFENLGGQLVDFLGRVPSSGSAVLVEIKTPETPLLGREYRDNVYPQSPELGGAIAQVLQYRESLLSNLVALIKGRPGLLSTSEPRCVVIAGNAARQLADANRKGCFERARERLFGVTVVTYDELFDRVAGLIALLEQP